MMSAELAMRKAIFSKLTGYADLLSLLGGAHVFDDVPQQASLPYITFGQSSVRDWSTGTNDGCEHVVTLHIWSKQNGRCETEAILQAVRSALHDQDLVVEDHRLVNLRHEFSETRRDADRQGFRGLMRFRAVTEPDAA